MFIYFLFLVTKFCRFQDRTCDEPEVFDSIFVPSNNFQAHQAQKLLDEFQKDIMAQRKELILKDSNANNSSEDLKMPQRNILMDHIILNEEKFTPEEIRDHILTFVSGYETWANALAHTMLLLAMHPEMQEKLHHEVQAKFLSDEDLKSTEKINSFKYLDSVIKEALRLMPTVPMVLRQPLEDFEIEPSLVIPKDTCLLINFFIIFRRKDIWGEVFSCRDG
jgi:cytochrome P450